MGRATLNQRHFAAGEIRPDLYGFTDLPKYQSALKKARNVFINKAGALLNVPGTQTIMPGKFPTKQTRQIPFKFSFNQQYDLIFGDKYIHVINNGSPVFNLAKFAPITIFPTGVNPTLTINLGSQTAPIISSGQIANGMLAQIQPSQPPNALLNQPVVNDFSLFAYNRWFIIQNVTINNTTTTFTLTDLNGSPINTSQWGTYNGFNLQINTALEIVTPYAHTDLANLNYAQSFSILQLRHSSYPRMQLSQVSALNWSLTNNNAWPNQIQEANNLGASGGNAGNVNYYYKVSTYNRTTKQESLPCPIANLAQPYQQNIQRGSTGPTTGVINWPTGNVVLVVGNTTGLTIGGIVYVSGVCQIVDNSDPFNPKLVTVLSPGTAYIINNLTPSQIVINTPPIWGTNLQFAAGTYVFNTTTSSSNQIASISNANPIVIQTTANHNFVNGQEVAIRGTGVFGLDGLNFTVTVQSPNTVSLNGVNGANYNLSGFVSSPSTIICPTAIISTNLTPTETSPITVVGTVIDPNIYTTDTVFLIYASTQLNSGYGLIGFVVPAKTTTTFNFVDQGIPPDPTKTPKAYLPLFFGVGNYPSDCNFYQQRLVEFATNNNPQGLWASNVGDYNDFTIHNPIQSNDAIIMTVWSTELQQIFHSAEAAFLILMTDLGPMVISGDSTGLFSPGTNLVKRQMFAGAAQNPRPLTIFKNVVYVEANQASLRDLEVLVTPFYTYIDKSDNFSLFSEHLLTASPVLTWDYKHYPDSQIVIIRKDGKMVFCTYLKEQELSAFTWRDTNYGNDLFQDVACVQEGTESFPYLTVKRQSGVWFERMASRYYQDSSVDAVFTDASAVYNGKFPGAVATLSGQTTAGGTISAQLNINVNAFQVGWQVNFKVQSPLYDTEGNAIFYYARMIVQSANRNIITGTLIEAIDPNMLTLTIPDVRVASNMVGGLWHLNGQNVAVVADGFVQANPQDDSMPTITVTNGAITLPSAFGVINVGLPYYSDMQTLDIDQHQGETFMDKRIGIPRVTLKLLQTGDITVGPNFTELLPATGQMDRPKLREMEGFLSPTNLFTGIVPINIDKKYTFGGSFCLRNPSPLPMAVLSIAPIVEEN